MAYIIGPDVSFYEDDPATPQGIDYVKMRKIASFVIVRAGQNLWPDPIFKETWAQAKVSGIPRGSYWFFDSRADPKRQAETYFDLLGGDLGELPLFADFEEAYKGPYQGWQQWYVFVERLKTLVGTKEIGIYTAFFYWRDHAPNPLFHPSELEYFHKYPLWIAHYNVPAPTIPKPWGANEWVFWQYTESGDGLLYGAESKGIDLNYFNGDNQAFVKRFNINQTYPPPPPPPPPPGNIDMTGYKFKVNATALNIRDGAGATFNKIGLLKLGDIVDGIQALPDKSWIQIRRKDGMVGWCAAQYLTVTVTPPPPPTTIDQTGIKFQVTPATLDVHLSWDATSAIAGTFKQGDIVDGIAALADKSWIQVKRASDGMTGWCAGASLTIYTPPPPGTIDLTGIKYQVNASTLDIHQTWDPASSVIGTLTQNTIVDAIIELADKSQIQIRRADGLTGWCAGSSLTVYTAPPPPTTIDQTGIKYQVNIPSLNMRDGAGVTYKIVGALSQGDIVDAIIALTDKSWIQVKRADGLIGWCSGAYLVVYTPPPPPPANQLWYKATAATLNVRSLPNTTSQIVGYLQKDDVVSSLAKSTDGSWAQISRVDGLTGWCSVQFLTNLGHNTPASWNQKIFTGVTYFHKAMTTPRSMEIHALGIDLQATGLQCLVTPPARQSGPPLCTQKTSDFLAKSSLQIAINGDAYNYADPTTYPPQTSCPGGGDPVTPNGYTASRGTVYFEKRQVEPVMFISRSNRILFVENNGKVQAPDNVFNAITGDRMLVKNGRPVAGLDTTRIDPRTAVGISKDDRFLIIVVVDGRETSIGATLAELAALLVSFGVYTGMSLDGGGSSTMVIQNLDGKPHILNTPVDGGIAGQERAVGDHLGIFVKKL